jgi:hypothetical protein
MKSLQYPTGLCSINTNTINKSFDSLISKLLPLIGSVITVFTDSGGNSGNGFTGVLIDVSPDLIHIVTAISSSPNIKMHHCSNSSHRTNNHKNQCDKTGAFTIIMLRHITAVTYKTI